MDTVCGHTSRAIYVGEIAVMILSLGVTVALIILAGHLKRNIKAGPGNDILLIVLWTVIVLIGGLSLLWMLTTGGEIQECWSYTH